MSSRHDYADADGVGGDGDDYVATAGMMQPAADDAVEAAVQTDSVAGNLSWNQDCIRCRIVVISYTNTPFRWVKLAVALHWAAF